MTDLTQRQQDLLNFIGTEITATGLCPTYREIGTALGMASTNGVRDHIQALVRKGMLEQIGGDGRKALQRSLRLTDAGRAAARYNGARVLGEVTGLGKAAVEQEWARSRANQEVLRKCVGPHKFTSPDPTRIGARFTCSACGGTVGGIEAAWYLRGFEHGRRDEHRDSGADQ
jgi:SOS-response transcriptional repressor LexA